MATRPTVSGAVLLAERQGKAVDALLGKARRYVRNGFLTEERGEECMSQLLRLGEKMGPLSASQEAVAEFWGLVEVAQGRLDALCGSVRVSSFEEVEEEIV